MTPLCPELFYWSVVKPSTKEMYCIKDFVINRAKHSTHPKEYSDEKASETI